MNGRSTRRVKTSINHSLGWRPWVCGVRGVCVWEVGGVCTVDGRERGRAGSPGRKMTCVREREVCVHMYIVGWLRNVYIKGRLRCMDMGGG